MSEMCSNQQTIQTDELSPTLSAVCETSYTFLIEDSISWKLFLAQHGYVVLKSVASPDELVTARDLYWNYFESRIPGICRTNELTCDLIRCHKHGIHFEGSMIQSQGVCICASCIFIANIFVSKSCRSSFSCLVCEKLAPNQRGLCTPVGDGRSDRLHGQCHRVAPVEYQPRVEAENRGTAPRPEPIHPPGARVCAGHGAHVRRHCRVGRVGGLSGVSSRRDPRCLQSKVSCLQKRRQVLQLSRRRRKPNWWVIKNESVSQSVSRLC